VKGTTLWLEKSRTDVCCHCRCKQGLVGAPGQLDCPWCGCGWLFTCIKCRKAFTFARPVRIDRTVEDLAEADWRAMFKKAPSKKDLKEWAQMLREFVGDLDEDEEYVYLDGVVIPVSATNFEFKGLFARHKLKRPPQVLALKRPDVLRTTLENVEYWTSRELPNRGE
jgi:hypothetical protein